ncbi:MAG: hypothetical protein PHX21_09315 [bacterium]|nr:hypothetical protein [bacterium]
MEDQSHLDKKYFIDDKVYNCPFCNRNNVQYFVRGHYCFDWSKDKECYVYFVYCYSCGKESMHLSYENISTGEKEEQRSSGAWEFYYYPFKKNIDIDSKIFYSVPTSFFVIDSRIPSVIRELITEAEGCLKMNFLTGASACMRKAIYELTIKEKATGDHYEDKIKSLKDTHPSIDPTLFDILAQIQGMTSDKIHEQSWDKWDSHYLTLIIETLKTILHEMYVEPKIKADRLKAVMQLQAELQKDKKSK